MRHWWRVTRYDPARRNARGAYTGNAWTSLADVGRSFEDGELTLDAYLRVEDAYVDAVTSFARECGADRVAVHALELGDELGEGQMLSIAEAGGVVRRMLREEAICRLEAPDGRFAVHVGFDLYLYIGAQRPCPEAVRRTRLVGLFVDEGFTSPQVQAD